MAATDSTTKAVRGEFAVQLIRSRRLGVEFAMVEALLVCGGDGIAVASGLGRVHLC